MSLKTRVSVSFNMKEYALCV